MEQTAAKLLSVVAIETLEKMAFIFGNSIETDTSVCADGPAVEVAVPFIGAFSGRVSLRISEAVLPELAANMLGIDENGPVDIEHQQDALREVANVVCGRLLPLIGGKEAEFSIAQPQIIDAEAEKEYRARGDLAASVKLKLEEGGCDLTLVLDGGLPAGMPSTSTQMAQQDMNWTTL